MSVKSSNRTKSLGTVVECSETGEESIPTSAALSSATKNKSRASFDARQHEIASFHGAMNGDEYIAVSEFSFIIQLG